MVDYTDVITEISSLLFKAISEREPDLRSKVHQLDRELYKLLRAVGLQVVSMLLACLSTQVTQEVKATGLVVQRRKQVKYTVDLIGNKRAQKAGRLISTPLD